MKEPVLWYPYEQINQDSPLDAQPLRSAFKWLRWAAGLPHLRRVEVRVGTPVVQESQLLFEAAWAEGEGAEGMLFRLIMDLVDAS